MVPIYGMSRSGQDYGENLYTTYMAPFTHSKFLN